MYIHPEQVRWDETHCGTPQCIYSLPGPGNQRFVVRRMDEEGLKWDAINLTVRGIGCGQIFAHGQSDTDCLRKATKFLNREE